MNVDNLDVAERQPVLPTQSTTPPVETSKTQPLTAQPIPEFPKKKSKIFLILLIFFVLFILGFVGYFVYLKNFPKSTSNFPTSVPSVGITPEQNQISPSPTPMENNESNDFTLAASKVNKDWLVYSNVKFAFSIEFPNSYNLVNNKLIPNTFLISPDSKDVLNERIVKCSYGDCYVIFPDTLTISVSTDTKPKAQENWFDSLTNTEYWLVEKTTINSIPTTKVVKKKSMPDLDSAPYTGYYIELENKEYLLKYNHTNVTPELLKNINKIISTFRFIE